MRFRLLAPAAAELHEAVAWYDEQAPGLSERFLDEMEAARKLIMAHPNAWHLLGNGVRRYRLERFPYGLIYVVEGDEIVILAVAHLHREPTYWESRVPKREQPA